jgi:NADPH:quinone reductase-like Zn-dependent oxidoreductase
MSHKTIAIVKPNTIGVATVPTPAPKAGEVQVKVDSAVFGPFDTYQIDFGFFVQSYDPPTILGLAGAGVITQVGEGVQHLAVGDRVAFAGFDGGADKSLQEIVTLSCTKIGKIPDSLDLEHAAAIPDNFITAWFTITSSLGIPLSLTTPPSNPAEPILVYGSGSSVGQYAIQVLKATGFTQIITTASSKHHASLRELGATHTFDYNSPSLAEDILKVTNGAKIKFAFDCVTTESSMKAIAGVVDKGSKVGFLLPIKQGTTVVGSKLLIEIPEKENPYPNGVEVIPTSTFAYQHKSADLKENLMPKIFPAVLANGSVKPNNIKLINSGTLEDRAKEAYAALTNGAGGARVVVKIAGSA